MTSICGVNQLPISEFYKTLVKPMVMNMIHVFNETKQHFNGKYEKLSRVLDEYTCLKNNNKKSIETCKKVKFFTSSPTTELPAGDT